MSHLGTRTLQCLLAIVFITSLFSTMPSHAAPTENVYLPHAVIRADSDQDLESLRSTGDLTGSGTAHDPYVIEGYEINATGYGNAIFIGNTTSYLVIRDCYLHGASNIGEYGVGAGIALFNASDVIVTNNSCNGNSYGIYLDGSFRNAILNNNCSSNSYGVQLIHSSSNNTLSNNDFSHCGNSIFLIYSSGNNTITNNDCSNSSNGIQLVYSCSNNSISNNDLSYCGSSINLVYSSSNNTVSNNTCRNSNNGINVIYASNNNTMTDNVCYNTNTGILLVESCNNTVSNNTCSDNVDFGIIMVSSSANNTVTNNICSHNVNYGIYLAQSSNNTLANNDCHGNNQGIYVVSSNNISVSNNNCSNNTDLGLFMVNNRDSSLLNNTCDGNAYGIFLQISNNNTVADNSCGHNANHGIYLTGSDGVNILANNTCNGNSYGIFLTQTSNNVVANNACSNNTNHGIFLISSCLNNIISDNTCNGNLVGIQVEQSKSNTIQRNSCDHNTDHGIKLYYSDSSNVTNNDCSYNLGHGVVINYSGRCTISNNTCRGNVNYGIYLYGNNYPSHNDNHLFGNVLAENHGSSSTYSSSHIQAFDNAVDYGNSWYRNYWSDWTAPDLDHDGIVDSAYVLDGHNEMDDLPVAMSFDILSPTPILTNVTTATVSGTAADGFGIGSIIWYNEATGASGTGTGTSSWTASVGLAEGENNITVTMTDHMGLTDSDNVTVILDTIAPSLAISSPDDGSYINVETVLVAWEGVDDGSGIADHDISIDDLAPIDLTSATTSYVFEGIDDGAHTVRVTVRDVAGNVNETTVSFTVDTVVPTANVWPTGFDVGIDATIRVVFSEAMDHPSVSMIINGVDAAATWDGDTAMFEPSLQYDGLYTVTVVGRDLAGNSVNTTWSFTTLKDEGTISGTVRGANGTVLGGAIVMLSNGLTTTTDTQGHFHFDNVSSGSYALIVTMDGYDDLSLDVSLVAGQAGHVGTLVLSASSVGTEDWLLIVVVIAIAALVGAVLLWAYRRKK